MGIACFRVFIVVLGAAGGAFGLANALRHEQQDITTLYWVGGGVGGLVGFLISSAIIVKKKRVDRPDEVNDPIPITRDASHSRINVSEMQTAIGRECAARANAEIDSGEIKLYRLTHVLNDFLIYKTNYQYDLTEAAIVRTLASLAEHARCEECDSNFWASVDILYASSRDAEQNQTKSGREQITVAAEAVGEHLFSGIGEILRESCQKLGALNEMDPLRLAAYSLHDLRVTFLDHSSPIDLPKLIVLCNSLCGLLACERAGAEIDYKKVILEMMAVCDWANHQGDCTITH